MTRIAFVTNIIPHYRLTFYRRLAAALAADGHDLRVLHGSTERDSARPAADLPSDCGFAHAHVRNRLYRFGPFHIRWQSGLLHALHRHRPHAIVISGIAGVLSSWLVLFWARLTRRPVIMWVCGWEAQQPGSVAYAFKRLLLRRFHRLPDALIVYSTKARDYMIRLGVPPARIAIAYNGLDTDEAAAHEAAVRTGAAVRRRAAAGDRRVFLYVGAMLAEKRVDLLLDAFAALNRPATTALWLVGDGPALPELRKGATARGLNTVTFWGRIVDEADELFAAADVFVLPGIGGLALNQAMFYGTPCICAEADGTEDDLVIDGQTGWRFTPGDRESLVLAMTRAADADDLPALGAAARDLVLTRGNVGAMVQVFVTSIRKATCAS